MRRISTDATKGLLLVIDYLLWVMQLLRLRRAVEAALFFTLLFSNTQGQLKTMNGRIIPWTDSEPQGPRNPSLDMYFDRVLHLILNKADAKYGCVPITTGVIIDDDRLLTAFNPFRELSKNLSMINEVIVQVNTGRTKTGRYKSRLYMNYHEVWSARQIMFTPEATLPSKMWHGRGAIKHSPLHDLMVMRVTPNFTRDEPFYYPDEAHYIYWHNKPNWIFKMPVAKPGDLLKYPMRYAQTNMRQEKIFQHFNFVETDNLLVDCDDYLPRFWGHFICISNARGQNGLSSGAILISNQTLFGVGSFSIKRARHDFILVFTDVRPYHEHILHAMTYRETGETF